MHTAGSGDLAIEAVEMPSGWSMYSIAASARRRSWIAKPVGPFSTMNAVIAPPTDSAANAFISWAA